MDSGDTSHGASMSGTSTLHSILEQTPERGQIQGHESERDL